MTYVYCLFPLKFLQYTEYIRVPLTSVTMAVRNIQVLSASGILLAVRERYDADKEQPSAVKRMRLARQSDRYETPECREVRLYETLGRGRRMLDSKSHLNVTKEDGGTTDIS